MQNVGTKTASYDDTPTNKLVAYSQIAALSNTEHLSATKSFFRNI